MPKLPAYVFRRANGSYRYKRNVPKKLVGLIGKATLYRQLGESYAEAMINLPQVHNEIDKLFRNEAHVPSGERALAIIRGALGSDVAEQVLAEKVVEYSQEDYALNELARDIAGELSDDIVTQIYTGRLKQPALTLQKALGEYQQYKTDDAGESRELELRVVRLRKDLGAAIGKQRVADTPLNEITRADANALRAYLLQRMKPSSVHRYITVVRAAVNYVITEHSLNIPNVFNGLRIKGASASVDDRLPMSDQDLAMARPNFDDDPVAHALFVALADTGARLLEITGLEVLGYITQLSPNVRKYRDGKDAGLADLASLSVASEGITLAPQTQARILKQMSQFLDWCVGEGELGANPWEALKVKDRPEVHPHGMLTDEQVSVLLAAKDRVLHSALLFGLLKGMRSGEICGLMAEDITAKGNLGRFVSIRPNAVRLLKSRAAEREVPLNGILEQLLDTALPKSGRLFPYLTVDRVVKRYA